MRNGRVRSYSGSGASCSLRMPGRIIRLHSTYIDSIFRSVAVRSAAWSGTPQMAHHARMSAGEGVVRACSIREHLDSCHPAACATCRAASASSACWALAERTGTEDSPRLDVPVFFVRHGTVPDRLERRCAQLDD